MKKNYILLSLVSFAGIVMTVLLLMDHYLPQQTVRLLSCGGGAASACSQLSLSSWSEVFGIPIASFGFFFYIWIFLSLHLFRESGERYWNTFIYLLMPVTVLGLLFDLVLGSILIYLQIFCVMCVTTYGLNILLFIVTLLEYRKIAFNTGVSLFSGVRSLPKLISNNEDRVFSSGTLVYYTVILFLFVISFSMFLGEKYGEQRENAGKFAEYLQTYQKKPQQDYDLPKTPFISGNPEAPLTVYVFTDPLCSACRVFHQMEGELLEKFDGKVQFHSYYFPSLSCDSENPKAPCSATLLMFSAMRAGKYDSVLVNYYDRYTKMQKFFDEGDIDRIIAELSVDPDMEQSLKKYYEDGQSFAMMQEHIDLAKKLHLSATPTLIINGRLLEGFPRKEYMVKILEFELKQLKEK